MFFATSKPIWTAKIWNISLKDQWPYPNQYQKSEPMSGFSRILQSGFDGHGCFCILKINVDGWISEKMTYQGPAYLKTSLRC